jgi:hypothetical protein
MRTSKKIALALCASIAATSLQPAAFAQEATFNAEDSFFDYWQKYQDKLDRANGITTTSTATTTTRVAEPVAQSSVGSSTNDKCGTTIAAVATPIAALLGVGFVTNLRIPAIDQATAQLNAKLAEANDNIQRGLGIHNEEASKWAREINAQLANLSQGGVNLTQSVGAVAAIAGGIGAIATIINNCKPDTPAPQPSTTTSTTPTQTVTTTTTLPTPTVTEYTTKPAPTVTKYTTMPAPVVTTTTTLDEDPVTITTTLKGSPERTTAKGSDKTFIEKTTIRSTTTIHTTIVPPPTVNPPKDNSWMDSAELQP